jgi:hypothetical protein
MELMIPQPEVQQDILKKLSHTLDLVLKTAEAASVENNHTVVIQAAREVTRLAGLMHKMTSSVTKDNKASGKKANLSGPEKQPAARLEPIGREKSGAGQTDTDDIHIDDFLMPDLETVFTPLERAYWKGLPDNIFQKFSDNYRELQAIGKEMAGMLQEANQEVGAGG